MPGRCAAVRVGRDRSGHKRAPVVASCPRCHNGGIADVSQHLYVVEMTRVSAEVRRDEAAINDIRDERKREPFTVSVAADIDPLRGPHLVPRRIPESVQGICAACQTFAG